MASVFRSNKQSTRWKRAVLKQFQEQSYDKLGDFAAALMMVLIDHDRKYNVTGTSSLVGMANYGYPKASSMISKSQNNLSGVTNRTLLANALYEAQQGVLDVTELILWRAIEATEKDLHIPTDDQLITSIQDHLKVFYNSTLTFGDDDVSFEIHSLTPAVEEFLEGEDRESEDEEGESEDESDDDDDDENFRPRIDLSAALPSPAPLPAPKPRPKPAADVKKAPIKRVPMFASSPVFSSSKNTKREL